MSKTLIDAKISIAGSPSRAGVDRFLKYTGIGISIFLIMLGFAAIIYAFGQGIAGNF